VLSFVAPSSSNPSFGGNTAQTPTESPCLPGLTYIGLMSTGQPIFEIDESAEPPRLYVLNVQSQLAWFTITPPQALPAAAAGCLTAEQQASWTAPIPPPPYQAPIAGASLPTDFLFNAAAAKLGLGSFTSIDWRPSRFALRQRSDHG
jgi:hypothetical protein